MKDARRYIVGVLLIIIAIMLIVLGFRAIANVFSNDDPEPVKQTSSSKKVDLLAAPGGNKAVQYTVRGPIVGNEQHQSIRITINRDDRRIEVLEGYNDNVIKSQTTKNTQEAYQAFIEAIYGAGFTNEVNGKDRGVEGQVCPLGRNFSFEVDPGRSGSFYSWSTSCSNKFGTFAGKRGTIDTLFRQQIPGYNNFVSGVRVEL